MVTANQNPEQIARDTIDRLLREAGWAVQDKKAINFTEGEGQAMCFLSGYGGSAMGLRLPGATESGVRPPRRARRHRNHFQYEFI